jgi:hypothetical protein
MQEVQFTGLAGTDCESSFIQGVLAQATQLQKVALSFDPRFRLCNRIDCSKFIPCGGGTWVCHEPSLSCEWNFDPIHKWIKYLYCSEIVWVITAQSLVISRDDLLHGDSYQYRAAQGMNTWSRSIEQVLPPYFFDELMGGTKNPHLIICYLTYLVAFCRYLVEWAFFVHGSSFWGRQSAS